MKKIPDACELKLAAVVFGKSGIYSLDDWADDLSIRSHILFKLEDHGHIECFCREPDDVSIERLRKLHDCIGAFRRYHSDMLGNNVARGVNHNKHEIVLIYISRLKACYNSRGFAGLYCKTRVVRHRRGKLRRRQKDLIKLRCLALEHTVYLRDLVFGHRVMLYELIDVKTVAEL